MFRDQATVLRDLLGRREDSVDTGATSRDAADLTTAAVDAHRVAGELEALRGQLEPVAVGPRAPVIAITSGKGGVGKSLVTLNLAVALAMRGKQVCVLDANPGLGNIDLMCGRNGYWNLSHVFTSVRTVSEVMLEGPRGIHIVPGAAALEELRYLPPDLRTATLTQLTPLETEHDLILIDSGSGLHRDTRRIVGAADRVVVLTTPEPTAIADAYATIKALCVLPEAPEPLILANLAESQAEGREIVDRIQQTVHTFLHREVASAGVLPKDAAVLAALRGQVPFVSQYPDSPVSRAVAQLARLIVNTTTARVGRPFFGRFLREH